MRVEQAKPASCERRELRELQRDAGLKRIGRTEGAADHRRTQAHRNDRDAVDADARAKHHQDGHERDDFLLHVLERAHRPEEDRDERNHQQTAVGEAVDEPSDNRRQGAEAIDDDPRAADEDDEKDDVGPGDEAARNRHGRRERADGCAFDWMKRAGDDNLASRRGVVSAVVLAGRDDPRQDRGEDDGGAEKDDGMWQTEARQPAANTTAASAPPGSTCGISRACRSASRGDTATTARRLPPADRSSAASRRAWPPTRPCRSRR